MVSDARGPEGTGDARMAEDEPPADPHADVRPHWEDSYLDQVGARLAYNFDLEKDKELYDREFDLYAGMEIENQRTVIHKSLSFANHFSYEHIFATRQPTVTRRDVEDLVEYGHYLGDEWLIPDEEHYQTDFSFVVITPHIPDDVREYVSNYQERALMKLGYHGHYEINLVVTAPDDKDIVWSKRADVQRAFTTWEDVENPERKTVLDRLLSLDPVDRVVSLLRA